MNSDKHRKGFIMGYCSKCGGEIKEGAKFCTKCGADQILSGKINDEQKAVERQVSVPKKKGRRKYTIILVVIISLVVVFGLILSAKYITAERIKDNLTLGNKYVQEGKYKEAVLAFEKVIKVDKKNIEARMGLARIYMGSNEYDKAEKMLKELLDIDGKNFNCKNQLIRLYILWGKDLLLKEKHTDAKELFNKAIGLSPKGWSIYFEIADIYIEVDKIDEAINILQRGYDETKNEAIKSKLDKLSKASNTFSTYEMNYTVITPIDKIELPSYTGNRDAARFTYIDLFSVVEKNSNKYNDTILKTELCNSGNSLDSKLFEQLSRIGEYWLFTYRKTHPDLKFSISITRAVHVVETPDGILGVCKGCDDNVGVTGPRKTEGKLNSCICEPPYTGYLLYANFAFNETPFGTNELSWQPGKELVFYVDKSTHNITRADIQGMKNFNQE